MEKCLEFKGLRNEEHSQRRGMAVDYSSQDFRQSLAAIDAASREGALSRDGQSINTLNTLQYKERKWESNQREKGNDL